jgi:S1-C subfamily serine protease
MERKTQLEQSSSLKVALRCQTFADILTNHHVIAHSTRITVVVPGRGPANASVVLADPSRDLALLNIPMSNLPYLSIGDSNLVHVLNTVYVLGYPLSPVLGGDVSDTRFRPPLPNSREGGLR